MKTISPTAPCQDLLKHIKSTVRSDLDAIDRLILEELTSSIPLIQSVIQHILKHSGKRLRPLLVVLSARACGYKENEHQQLATIIEFVHTATLLHDDVVDESKLRRGEQTANTIWGNQASVLVGDFLYSRAFQMLTRHGNIHIMNTLAHTTNAIAEGEVLQLMNQHDASLSENQYLDVIYRKTAKLFESSMEIGATLANDTQPTLIRAMAEYGHHLGMCFQVIDDLMDYTGSTGQIGKNIGDDLTDGKLTLPLIHALKHCNEEQSALITESIEQGNPNNLATILDVIQQTQAYDYCLNKAQEYAHKAQQALHPLPKTVFKDALFQLVDFAIRRTY